MPQDGPWRAPEGHIRPKSVGTDLGQDRPNPCRAPPRRLGVHRARGGSKMAPGGPIFFPKWRNVPRDGPMRGLRPKDS
eukprot:3481299-Pyramimonas_sp.AAC.3